MKITLSGDWHYTDKTPTCRIDDYPSTLMGKIEEILRVSQGCCINHLLQAGDLTDSPFLSYATYIKLASLLGYYKEEVFVSTVLGQHDLRYRNKGNTPVDALESHGLVTIKDANPCYLVDTNVCIYGCSFGEQHPQIQDPNAFNILILHQLIVSSQERDWEKDQVLHSALLENSKWDLIVSGDNHLPFIISTKDERRHLINCGSLMRSTIDQVDHEPFFVIFDTDTRTYEKHFLKIKPWQEVFDLEKKVKQEERNENLEIYAESLKEQKDMGLDYTANLIAYIRGNKVEKPVEDIVTECITETN